MSEYFEKKLDDGYGIRLDASATNGAQGRQNLQINVSPLDTAGKRIDHYGEVPASVTEVWRHIKPAMEAELGLGQSQDSFRGGAPDGMPTTLNFHHNETETPALAALAGKVGDVAERHPSLEFERHVVDEKTLRDQNTAERLANILFSVEPNARAHVLELATANVAKLDAANGGARRTA